MNEHNDKAVSLRQEIDNLEDQISYIARNASMNLVGLGDEKGRKLSVGGLVIDGIDITKISNEINQKLSELSFEIGEQIYYEKEAKKNEQMIFNYKKKVNIIGCL